MWLTLLTVTILYSILVLWTNASMYAVEKQKRVIYLILGGMIILFISMIAVWMTPIQLENAAIANRINWSNGLLFAAINSLAFLPSIGKIYNRIKTEQITEQKAKNKIILRVILFVAVLIFEVNYMHSFQGTLATLTGSNG